MDSSHNPSDTLPDPNAKKPKSEAQTKATDASVDNDISMENDNPIKDIDLSAMDASDDGEEKKPAAKGAATAYTLDDDDEDEEAKAEAEKRKMEELLQKFGSPMDFNPMSQLCTSGRISPLCTLYQPPFAQ